MPTKAEKEEDFMPSTCPHCGYTTELINFWFGTDHIWCCPKCEQEFNDFVEDCDNE